MSVVRDSEPTSSILEHAPRLLNRRQAAAYCNLSPMTFLNWVRSGKLPPPLPGTTRWDLKAIDVAVDTLSGPQPPTAPKQQITEGAIRIRTSIAANIPLGSWPRRMGADLAAAYCGEPSIEGFLKRVGKDYPNPRVSEGRRRLWLKDDLDAAILPPEMIPVKDIAEDI